VVDLKEEIWNIWSDTHNRIGPLRELAFKIQGYVSKDFFLQLGYDNSLPDKDEPDQTLLTVPPEKYSMEHVGQAEQLAMKYQRKTEDLKKVQPYDILQITSRAGHLLGLTEKIMAYREYLSNNKTSPPLAPAISNQPPNSTSPAPASGMQTLATEFILSSVMTIVATARDLLDAADGHLKNWETKIGIRESAILLLGWLVPAVVIYLVLHPIFGSNISIADIYRVPWEVLFWSWFGAVCMSLITLAEDMLEGKFDPRKLEKYRYKIPVSPFVAAVIVLFLTTLGFSVNESAGPVQHIVDSEDLSKIGVVMIISFLLGFFGKRTLDLLDQAWRRIFPDTRPSEGSDTKKTDTKK